MEESLLRFFGSTFDSSRCLVFLLTTQSIRLEGKRRETNSVSESKAVRDEKIANDAGQSPSLYLSSKRSLTGL